MGWDITFRIMGYRLANKTLHSVFGKCTAFLYYQHIISLLPDIWEGFDDMRNWPLETRPRIMAFSRVISNNVHIHK